MDNTTALTLGGIFMAVCNALTDEQARIAKDALWRFAQNPGIKSAEAKRAWGHIAHSASLSADEAERENAELDAMASRPPFRIITGGAA
jgi:hypothetical protein